MRKELAIITMLCLMGITFLGISCKSEERGRETAEGVSANPSGLQTSKTQAKDTRAFSAAEETASQGAPAGQPETQTALAPIKKGHDHPEPVTTSTASALKKASILQKTDLLSGQPINDRYYVDYEGKRIYFCCGLHRLEFYKDPKTYFKHLQDKAVPLEDAPASESETGGKAAKALRPQTTDLATGNQANYDVYADYKGKRIYFCCENSKKKYGKALETLVKAAQFEGIALQDTPQGAGNPSPK